MMDGSLKINFYPVIGRTKIDVTFFCFQLEQRDVAASQTLRAALCKAEASHPGVSYDLVS